MQSRQGTRAGSDRPKSSLSEHVAREIQRDYPLNPRPGRRHEPLRTSAGGIKRFMFATAGGVKRISVATGRRSAKVGGTLKRSATGLAKMAYKEWKYSDYSTKNIPYGYPAISSPIIVPNQPETPQLSPFFTSSEPATPIGAPPPSVNPALSIEELLRAYGVAPGPRPFQRRMPPPPARAIFPPGYPVVNRVHVRSRPGSARPFTRSGPSSRPDTQHMRVPSVLSSNPSRPSTRSDAASDVLGHTSMYLEVRRASPVRPRTANERPSTTASTVPRLRSQRPIVEVVSCGTQTTPPPMAARFGREARSTVPASAAPIVDSEGVEAVSIHPRQRIKRSRGGKKRVNRLTPASVKTEIIVEGDSAGQQSRDHGTQSHNRGATQTPATRRVISTSTNGYSVEASRVSLSSETESRQSSYHNEQHGYPQIPSYPDSYAIGPKSPAPGSPMSSTFGPQTNTTSRALNGSSRSSPKTSSKRSPPVVRVEPATPVYQIPVVNELFDRYPSRADPALARPFQQSAPGYRNTEPAARPHQVNPLHSTAQNSETYHHFLID